MSAILDAILNSAQLALVQTTHPSFFYLPRGLLQGSRVKMWGHLIAHGVPVSPRITRGFRTILCCIVLAMLQLLQCKQLLPVLINISVYKISLKSVRCFSSNYAFGRPCFIDVVFFCDSVQSYSPELEVETLSLHDLASSKVAFDAT